MHTVKQRISGTALTKRLVNELGIPSRLAYPLVRAVKIAAHPVQAWQRKQALGGLPPPKPTPAEDTLERDGYRIVGPGELPGLDEVVARCQALVEEGRESRQRSAYQRNPKKDFLLSVVAGDEFCRYPELIRFMVSRPIVATAARYLGAVPLLAAANLWWSPPNETQLSSQRYHIDKEDRRQLKLVVNVTDTDEAQGPFTFLPASLSEVVQGAQRRRKRHLSDEALDAVGVGDGALRLVGPAGSAAFVDTSRCLHHGSRGNTRDRFVLQLQFLRFDSPLETPLPFRPQRDLGFAPDRVQRLALGLA